MRERILVFDMDGVLAEVGESYREGVVQTVRHFTGRTVPRERIQDYKNAGGWNNDWALSQRLCRDYGSEVSYEAVVDYFVSIFLGPGGLIEREAWLAEPGLLERLAGRFRLSLFTGRNRAELTPTLARFAPEIRFEPIITSDDITNGKPSPDGLNLVRSRHPGAKLWYIGDTVDDARSARAAGVPFIGIAAGGTPPSLFLAEGATHVIASVNKLEEVLPQ